MIKVQPKQKVSKIPVSISKLGMVHTCGSSYVEGLKQEENRGLRPAVDKKRPYLKNKAKRAGGCGSNSRASAYLVQGPKFTPH
jgi:hypothetical protein